MTQEEKKTLRKRIKALKGSMATSDLRHCSAQLMGLLEQSERFRQARTVLCYYSLPDEVGTHDFVEKWKDAKQVLLPVVKGEELELRRYTGRGNLVTAPPFYIEEPRGEPFTDYDAIDLALVPGMSFDAQGNRLGRGKGFYDRLLPRLRAYKIGICFAFQVSAQVPCEAFDRPMDAVLTEQGWLTEK